jgi:hypothetical protein
MVSSTFHKHMLAGIIVLVAALLVACGRAEPGITTISLTTSEGAASVPGLITSTPFPPSTDTPIPTPSFTPSITPTFTPSLTPTFIPSPIPTETLQPPIRFAVIGDYGSAGPEEADVADLINSWSPDFVITTGDNNYPNGSEETID